MPRIALIPGDGIGKEVVAEAEKVLRALGLKLEMVHWPHGADHYLETGVSISQAEVAELQRDYDAILLGALGDSRVPSNIHARDILLGLRFQLDLYINFRPVRLLDPRLTPLRDKGEGDINFVIFRENTEGVYVGMGGTFKRGTPDEIAIQEDVNTRKGVERIIRAAFEFARARQIPCVTLSDKANAMEHAGGLWRRTFADVGAEYPEIEPEALYVDMLAMDLIRRPERYRVIVTGNLFGDILSDLGAQLAGGLGLAASANVHPGRTSLFEPVHGSAPDIAGRGIANPFGAILSSALMLGHLGFLHEQERVEKAVRKAVQARQATPDLGGGLSTAAAGDAVCRLLTGGA
ncbi:MAG: 3-isopropylmalate dehydrogenase [Gemmatimonadota bacterium]|jgi:3-isopropylmalate dehydrogenase|nr:3-isopropylmalate dehydrogenase [Gemmatimonadota bacterium]